MAHYVYVASSWRNEDHPKVVDRLREEGIACYDFKRDEGAQFHWSEVDPSYKETWDGNFHRFVSMLNHSRAVEGFYSDFRAMENATAFVLVHPAGRSAHLESGWAIGRGIPTAIYFPRGIDEPDLMYGMASRLTESLSDLILWLEEIES